MPKWGEAEDRLLLLSIIQLGTVTLPKWDMLAEKMGEGYTGEAVRQHYQKLKRETLAPGFTSPAKSTKGAATPEGKKVAARGGGKRKTADAGDADTPEKAPTKGRKPRGKGKVKTEVDDGGSPSKKAKLESEEEDETKDEDAEEELESA